jgi:hypothetical protein
VIDVSEPQHLVLLLAGIPVALVVGLVVVAAVGKIVEGKLSKVELVTVAVLEKYLDERMKRHEEWEAKLQQASRDVLRELIESYHRQGLDAVDQARRIAVRVATDFQAITDQLRKLEERLSALESRSNK